MAVSSSPEHSPSVGGDEGSPAFFRRLLGHLLRWGVALAAVLLGLGVLLAYRLGGTVGQRAPLSGSALLHALAAGGPTALILAGLVVLVLTPFVRVLISFVIYATSGDRAFATITAIVLVLLTGTILVGGHP
jgi:uncharacterized membrane protein